MFPIQTGFYFNNCFPRPVFNFTLFKEKWHLKLSTNLSQVEGKEAQQNIAKMELEDLKGSKGKLNSLEDSPDGSELLRLEIERLKNENNDLKNKIILSSKESQGKHEEAEVLELKLKIKELQDVKGKLTIGDGS